MTTDASLWRRPVYFAGWLLLVWAAVSAGRAYLLLPDTTRPDRALVDMFAIGMHAAAILLIAFGLPRFAPSLLKILPRLEVLPLLLVMLAAGQVYNGPFHWLFPLAGLLSLAAFALILGWLAVQEPDTAYRAGIAAGVWWVSFLICFDVARHVSGIGQTLSLDWLRTSAETALYGGFLAVLWLLPLTMLAPAARGWLYAGAEWLAGRSWLVYAGLFGLTGLALWLHWTFGDGIFTRPVWVPVLLGIGSLAGVGGLLLRGQAPILAALAPFLHSPRFLLEGLLGLLMVGFLWMLPYPVTQVIWYVITDDLIATSYRGMILYKADYLALLAMIVLAALLLHDDSLRRTAADTVRRIFWHYGGLFWLLLIGWMAVSMAWTQEPRLAGYAAFRILTGLLIALMVAFLVRRGQGRGLLVAFSLFAAGQGAISAAQIVRGESLGLVAIGEIQRDPLNPFGLGLEAFRGSGLTGHPNFAGILLMIGLFTALALMRLPDRLSWKIGAACLPLIGAGLVATASRGAIFGILPGLALIGVFLPRPRLPAVNRWLLVGGAALVLVGLTGLAVATRETTERLINVIGKPQAVMDRLAWKLEDTQDVWEENPIRGAGAGNLLLAIARNRPDSTQKILIPAHNSYMVIMAENGIIGLGLFLLAWGASFWHLRPSRGAVAFTLGGALIGICITIFVDKHFLDMPQQRVFFWTLGLWWGWLMPPASETA